MASVVAALQLVVLQPAWIAVCCRNCWEFLRLCAVRLPGCSVGRGPSVGAAGRYEARGTLGSSSGGTGILGTDCGIERWGPLGL